MFLLQIATVANLKNPEKKYKNYTEKKKTVFFLKTEPSNLIAL